MFEDINKVEVPGTYAEAKTNDNASIYDSSKTFKKTKEKKQNIELTPVDAYDASNH